MSDNHDIDIDQAARIFRSVFGTATSEARQNVVDAVDRYANELERECAEATDAVEAESFEFLNELALTFRSGEKHARPQYTQVLEGIRAVLAHLTTAGRLIPAGGMPLTAEQVEDVEALVATANPYSAPAARLRALFPATEPAEDAKPCGSNSITLGWCKLTARHEGLHTNGTYLWGTPSEPDPPAPSEPAEERCQSVSIFRERCALVPGHDGRHAANGCAWGYTPTPAEPAEEETKAESHIEKSIRKGALAKLLEGILEADDDGWHLPNGWFPTDLAEAIVYAPASSPVVPAPTETGPWQRIEDVPEGVLQIKDRHGRTWLVVGGTWRFEWHDGNWYEPHTNINAQAPFVAADEEG